MPPRESAAQVRGLSPVSVTGRSRQRRHGGLAFESFLKSEGPVRSARRLRPPIPTSKRIGRRCSTRLIVRATSRLYCASGSRKRLNRDCRTACRRSAPDLPVSPAINSAVVSASGDAKSHSVINLAAKPPQLRHYTKRLPSCGKHATATIFLNSAVKPNKVHPL